MLDDLENPHEQIEAERAEWVESHYINGDSMALFRNYVRGKQPLPLTAEQREILKGLTPDGTADNLCAQVVSEAAGRLTLEAAECADANVQEYLGELWAKCHLPAVSNTCHWDALQDGLTCLAAFWREPAPGRGRVVIVRQPYWNPDDSEGVFVREDEEGNAAYAVNQWKERRGHDVYLRRVLWTENALYRYESPGGGAWRPLQLPGDSAWPVPWVKRDGSPLHVPFVVFANGAQGGAQRGYSELAGGPRGIQDTINDCIYALQASMRGSGYGERYVTNANAPTKSGPGFWHAFFSDLPRDEAGNVLADLSSLAPVTVGTIPPGDMAQMLAVTNDRRRSMARNTRTPDQAIVNGETPPSGEALYRSELPAVGKALRQIAAFSPSWATLLHRAVEQRNAFSALPLLSEEAIISVRYANPDRLDDLKRFMGLREFYTALKAAVEAGVPLSTALKKQGWTEDDIKAMYEDKAEESRQGGARDTEADSALARQIEAMSREGEGAEA